MKRLPFELIFWTTALISLAMAKPGEYHYTLCPLANLGVNWCPGCGIGRSITLLFHGQWHQSFEQHWLGLPALVIISFRMLRLAKMKFLNNSLTLKYQEESNHV